LRDMNLLRGVITFGMGYGIGTLALNVFDKISVTANVVALGILCAATITYIVKGESE